MTRPTAGGPARRPRSPWGAGAGCSRRPCSSCRGWRSCPSTAARGASFSFRRVNPNTRKASRGRSMRRSTSPDRKATSHAVDPGRPRTTEQFSFVRTCTPRTALKPRVHVPPVLQVGRQPVVLLAGHGGDERVETGAVAGVALDEPLEPGVGRHQRPDHVGRDADLGRRRRRSGATDARDGTDPPALSTLRSPATLNSCQLRVLCSFNACCSSTGRRTPTAASTELTATLNWVSTSVASRSKSTGSTLLVSIHPSSPIPTIHTRSSLEIYMNLLHCLRKTILCLKPTGLTPERSCRNVVPLVSRWWSCWS